MRSPLSSYIGGKFRLSRKIVSSFCPHELYVEVFAGSAAVLFEKPKERNEVLNDLNGDIVNFFEQCRENMEGLKRRAKFRLYSRALFERYRAEPLASLPPVERAYRFWHLLKCSYGGRLCVARKADGSRPGRAGSPKPGMKGFYNPSFGQTRNSPHCALRFSDAEVEAWHERLSGVIIENRPWQEILERHDREGALFYLDPPYYGSEGAYSEGLFQRPEYAEMAEMLAGMKGRFLLSLNDRPEVREIFGAFRLNEVQARYTLAARRMKAAAELFISNYELPRGG